MFFFFYYKIVLFKNTDNRSRLKHYFVNIILAKIYLKSILKPQTIILTLTHYKKPFYNTKQKIIKKKTILIINRIMPYIQSNLPKDSNLWLKRIIAYTHKSNNQHTYMGTINMSYTTHMYLTLYVYVYVPFVKKNIFTYHRSVEIAKNKRNVFYIN